MKKTMLILVVMLVASTGCEIATGPKEAVEETSKTNVNDFAGVYALVTVDGIGVPATFSHSGHDIMVHSGSFTINTDGTCSSAIVHGPQKSTRQTKATYTQAGSTLTMKWKGAGWTKGTIEGDIFSMNNEGMIFSYKKNKE